METTLIVIKPDGVKKGLDEKKVVEGTNLIVVASKRMKPSLELAEAHYNEHKDKAHFKRITEALASGEVIAMLVFGMDAIKVMRKKIGAVDKPGTLRGDYSNPEVRHENGVHGSDSVENAEYEIKLWFPDY